MRLGLPYAVFNKMSTYLKGERNVKNKSTTAVGLTSAKVLLAVFMAINFMACKNESKTVQNDEIFVEEDLMAFDQAEVERVAMLKAAADQSLETLGELKTEYWDLVDNRNELHDDELQSNNPELRVFLNEIEARIAGLDVAISTQTENATLKRGAYTEALEACDSCSQIDLQDVEFQVENARLEREIEDLEISIEASGETIAFQTDMISRLRDEILALEDDKAGIEERISGLDASSSELLVQLHDEVARISGQIESKLNQIEMAQQSQRASYLAIDAAASAKQALEDRM